ncbi:NADH dehydrogenase subunit 2 (mitochondrion) [Saccostrea cucullata]|uniref:NADH-ubiquinone oxidoreductase chain 2 n=1 Tax=Saccostrea cuccullata TaxID=36930 RepID=A0A0U2A1P9_9BIVA|nr:NADH dehydrogenase subunit 2 [Saccostrea cucullata]AKE32253.1 NADH dehydrogenase subunit 2 [Saccostrea cucullata]
MYYSLAGMIFMLLGLYFALVVTLATSVFWVWVAMDLSTIFLVPFFCCGMSLTGLYKWYKGSATYFVVQFMGSASILYSGLMLWEFSFEAMGLTFLMTGFILKLGLFPLHFWVPRAFMNFHYPGIYLSGVAQKVLLIPAIPFLGTVSYLNDLLSLSAIASVLYGPVAMFNCTNIKTFLAYSSVNNTGLLVICMGMSKDLFVFYAICYSVSMLFLVLILSVCMSDTILQMGRTLPDIYLPGFMAMSLSFAGFPPLTDFCAKFVVVSSFVESNMWFYVAVILISSVVNLLAWVWVHVVVIGMMRHVDDSEPSVEDLLVNLGSFLWNVGGGGVFMMFY